MNSILNITVRVAADQAKAAIKQINDQVAALGNSGAGSASLAGGVSQSTSAITGLSRAMSASALTDFGKNLQWTGRQLEMNFTLPLVLAGGAVTKWSLDNQRAMTQLKQVYGDANITMATLNAETSSLGKTFELLSDRFGVNQAKVIEIGAAWAQAGVSGVDLAKATRQTLETMVVGGQTSEQATKGLITLMATFHLSADELHSAMMGLNAIENTTAVSTQDLLDVLQRAGGSAVTAGVGIDQLSAMAAALVPNAANASQAGNSLRTMLTRIMAPTAAATALFKEMGINVLSAGWQSQTGSQRLNTLAIAFSNLSDAQKTVVAQAAAGTFQISRFDVLMQAMADTAKHGLNAQNGYAVALKATSDKTAEAANYQKELTIALGSNPSILSQLTNILKNNLTTAFQSLLPTLIGFTAEIVRLAQWFNHLSPQTQQLVIIMLALLAVVGPITRYVGAFTTLFGLAGSVMGKFGGAISAATGKLAEHRLANQIAAADAAAGWDEASAAIAAAQIDAAAAAQESAMATQAADRASALVRLETWNATERERVAASAVADAEVELGWAQRAAREAEILANSVVINGGSADAIAAAAARVTLAWDAAGVANENLTRTTAASAAVVAEAWQAVAESEALSAQASALAWERADAATVASARAAALGRAGAGVGSAGAGAAEAGAGAAAAGLGGAGAAKEAESVARSVEKQKGIWAGLWDFISGGFMKVFGIIDVLLLGLPGLVLKMAGGIGRGLLFLVTDVPALIGRAMVALAGFIPDILVGAFEGAATAVGAVVEALGGWIVTVIILALVAITVALNKFTNGAVFRFIKDIMNAFLALPGFLIQVFGQVVNIIASAMRTVIGWLSYLNPWARHSPSLVDNVTSGVTAILSQYARLGGIGAHLQGSYNALSNFTKATGSAADSMANQKVQDQRQAITDTVPTAGPAFDALIKTIAELRPALRSIGDEYASQKTIVDQYSDSLDQAKLGLQAQQDALTGLKAAADQASAALSDAKDALSQLTDHTQLAGYGAMQDAIFANKMAQDQLNLSILQMGVNADKALSDAQNKVAALQGDIETLEGKVKSLRLGGAGSDITGPLQAQIAALQAAQGATQASVSNSPLKAMQDQLAQLQNEGQQLDLKNTLQFDPLNRQIQAVTSSMQEMPFDQLLAQTKAAKANVDNLTAAYNDANDAVKAQQAVVDQSQAAVKAAQDAYDAQNATLGQLGAAYDAVAAQISNAESAINDFSQASQSAAAKKASNSQQQFAAGAGANFADVQGTGGLGGPDSGQKAIDDFNKQLQSEINKNLGKIKFDPFKPIKEAWDGVWRSIKGGGKGAIDAVSTPIEAVKGWIVRNFSLKGLSNIWETTWNGISHFTSNIWNKDIEPIFETIGNFVNSVLGPPFLWLWHNVIEPAWNGISTAIGVAWSVIQPIFQAIWDFINNYLVPIFQLLFAIVEIVFVAIGLVIVGAWTVIKTVFEAIWNFINNDLGPIFMWLWHNIIEPVWDGISKAISWAWNNIIHPILQGIWDFINNVLGPAFLWIWHTIIEPVWDGISGAISFAWNNVISPALGGMKDFIYNVLGPAFTWLRDNVIKPVFDGIKSIIEGIWNGITGTLKTGINLFISAFNDVAGFVRSIGGALGISVKINDMPPLKAAGGVIPAVPVQGGMFNDIRAIVGEGSKVYPEFVIPTDPKYRQNALDLMKQAGMKLFSFGGVVSGAGHLASDVGHGVKAGVNAVGDAASAAGGLVADAAGHLKRDAVEALLKPVRDFVNGAINDMPFQFVRDAARHLSDEVFNWVGGKEAFDGAIIKGSVNGSIIRAGERNQSEAIIPLPDGMKNLGKTVIINGNLSFPNVKNGDDAESFLDNLEKLA